MKRINIPALLVCAALIALVLLSPTFIDEKLATDFFYEWLKPKREEWTGVLSVWHIGTWPVGKGASSQYLTARAKEFEKKYPGVYIEVESMTPNGANERFERGERPDIVSFPGGWGQAVQLIVLPDDCYDKGIYEHLLESGRVNNKQIALPYMLSCYMLMYNEDLFSDADIELPYETDAESFSSSCAKMTYTKKLGKKTLSYVGLEIPEIEFSEPAYALIVNSLLPGADNYVYGSAAFKGGASALTLGTLRDMAEPERYTFSTKLEPLSNYTDMVQYAGVWKDVGEKARPYALAFVGYLTEEKPQTGLEKLWMFPVRKIESMYDSEPALKELSESVERMSVPRTFYFSKSANELSASVKSALDGDERIAGEVSARLGKVCVKPKPPK